MNNIIPPQTKFLRLPEVLAVYPVGRTTWYAGMKTGRFPKPMRLTASRVVWRAEDIRSLIDDPECFIRAKNEDNKKL